MAARWNSSRGAAGPGVGEPRRSSMELPPKVRFAPDSPLEGDGFEPSVPREGNHSPECPICRAPRHFGIQWVMIVRTLERFPGDGMIALFNDPVPTANPAECAIRTAASMRARIAGP